MTILHAKCYKCMELFRGEYANKYARMLYYTLMLNVNHEEVIFISQNDTDNTYSFFSATQRFPFYHCGGAYYLAVRQADRPTDRPTDRLTDRSTDQNRTDREGRLTSDNVCRVEGKEKVWDKKKMRICNEKIAKI